MVARIIFKVCIVVVLELSLMRCFYFPSSLSLARSLSLAEGSYGEREGTAIIIVKLHRKNTRKAIMRKCEFCAVARGWKIFSEKFKICATCEMSRGKLFRGFIRFFSCGSCSRFSRYFSLPFLFPPLVCLVIRGWYLRNFLAPNPSEFSLFSSSDRQIPKLI